MMAASLIGWSGLAAEAPLSVSPFAESIWDYSVTARTGAGYKDNVTLAHTAPQSSPFSDASLEVIAARLPPEGTEATFFGSFEDHRFLSDISVDKEQLGFGQAELSRWFGPNWQAGVSLEYFYQDQFVDVSLTETNREALRVQGHALVGRPKVRRELGNSVWLELDTPVGRQLLRSPLDNYWETGPRLSLGYRYGYSSELGLSYQVDYRTYDHEEAVSAEGEPIPGTHRVWWYHKLQWSWRHYWDEARRWRTTTRVSTKITDDNSSGYFNYTGVDFSEQLRYRTGLWEASGEIKFAQYQYEVQTVSLTDPAHRNRKELFLNLRLERKLAKHLRLFAQYEREQVFSNIPIEQYTASTVTGGALWEF